MPHYAFFLKDKKVIRPFDLYALPSRPPASNHQQKKKKKKKNISDKTVHKGFFCSLFLLLAIFFFSFFSWSIGNFDGRVIWAALKIEERPFIAWNHCFLPKGRRDVCVIKNLDSADSKVVRWQSFPALAVRPIRSFYNGPKCIADNYAEPKWWKSAFRH